MSVPSIVVIASLATLLLALGLSGLALIPVDKYCAKFRAHF